MTVTPYRTKGGRRYRYEFRQGRQRFGKGGFLTKAEALSAQEVHRLQVRAGYSVAYSTFRALVDSFLLASTSTKSAEWAYQLKLNSTRDSGTWRCSRRRT